MTDVQSAAESGIRFRVILFNGDKQVRKLNTRKRGRILLLLRNPKYVWDRLYLQVRYNDKGDQNEGYYTTVEEAHMALLTFCEPEILKYVAKF